NPAQDKRRRTHGATARHRRSVLSRLPLTRLSDARIRPQHATEVAQHKLVHAHALLAGTLDQLDVDALGHTHQQPSVRTGRPASTRSRGYAEVTVHLVG